MARQLAVHPFRRHSYNPGNSEIHLNSLTPFLTLTGSADETLQRLRQPLSRAGLRLLQTFDLSEARLCTPDCPCPRHGQIGCDCQMVVILVYVEAAPPVTLVLHSNEGRTWLSLVDTPAQQAQSSVRLSIERALQMNSP